ncbi:hypothetical protein BASA81_005561 [Batrachochytrium salamandrivorans]|nr:hypothetical protein BASA81_005561 [Batrachochytrium salamandrivorans]
MQRTRGMSSFVARMKQKIADPFSSAGGDAASPSPSSSTTNAHSQRGMDDGQAIVKLLKSTPPGQFNLKVTRAHYCREQEQAEQKLNSSSLLPKEKQNLLSNIEQMKIVVKTIDCFDEVDQEYPQFVSERTKTRASEITLQSKQTVDQLVRGVVDLGKFHEFICRSMEKGREVGDTMQQVEHAFMRDPDTLSKRKRNVAGSMLHLYMSRGAPHKKNLKPVKVPQQHATNGSYALTPDELIATQNDQQQGGLKLSISPLNFKVNKALFVPQLEKKGRMFGNQQVSATRKLYEQKPILKKWERKGNNSSLLNNV